ncbi:MAG TPA: neutral zinc metallopeptidase [Bryobacteraceae bacterium]|nr:neutral zinc metallopeptidase [Bryobacteraceae bacterium]
MRWTPGGRSENLEDMRGASGGFGGSGMRIGLGGLLVLGVLSAIFGVDLITPFTGGGSPAPSQSRNRALNDPQEEKMVQFVSFVLDDAQRTWGDVLPRFGSNYRDAKLVLFRDGIRSGCGIAGSATGPFYCPGDEKVYLDLSFFEELDRRFGAPGDFAQAYVITHEIGHHVQNLLGIERRFRQSQRMNPGSANSLSVRMELQADCFAGVWGHSTGQRQILEQGDVEEGLRAAAAIGDDRLQRMGQGYVNPDSFTHGTSQQRVHWFRRGLETGDVRVCDTFNPDQP